MKICDRTECSIATWYPVFRRHTVKSLMVPVPDEVIKYLEEDGIVLPLEATPTARHTSSRNEEDSDEEIDWSEEEQVEMKPPFFPEFSKSLENAIYEYGGEVFIKLNWSAPTDAAWITPQKSLKCSSLEDIYLLLKSSNKIAQDLEHLNKQVKKESGSPSVCLVLRKWLDIHPGTEFRCFVAQNKLLGITQRDCTEYHSHLAQSKHDIIEDIMKFFEDNIKGKFGLSTFVFDVVRTERQKIKLIDFGMFNSKYTKSYLFSWEELHQLSYKVDDSSSAEAEFRFIAEPTYIQFNFDNHFGVPQDLIDFSEQQRSMSLVDIVQMEARLQDEENKANEMKERDHRA